MRPSVIMLAVIAFVLAGAAAFLVKVFLERQTVPVVQEAPRPTGIAKVLVASRNINPGEVLSSKDVSWAEWPEALVEERMILESEFVIPSATVPPTQVGLVVRAEAPGGAAETAPAAAPAPAPAADGEAASSTEGAASSTEEAATASDDPAISSDEAATSTNDGMEGSKPAAQNGAGEGAQDMAAAEGGAAQPAPAQQVASGTGNAENDIVGAVARRRILANEPISPDALIQRGDRSIGSAVVSPGMRAISIKISAATGAGGFIAPGDYVDVLLSIGHEIKFFDENGKAQDAEGRPVVLPDGDTMVKYTTETVMRNVKVLAIDQSLARNEDAGPADVGKTATVEVSPRDAEKLLTAGQLGSLTLVLRSLVVDQTAQDEIDAFEDPFNFVSDVATSRAVAAILTDSGLGYGPVGNSVRVNRGGAVTQEGY